MLATVTLSACSLLPGAIRSNGPSAEAASTTPGSAPTSGASPADAVPDPLNPERHVAGDEVDVAGATVVYLGLARHDGRIVGRFQLVSGRLSAAPRMVTPDGDVIDLVLSAGVLESAPFGDAGRAPPREATITLVIGDDLIPFEAGKLS